MKELLLISTFAMLTTAFTYAQAPVITNSFVSNLTDVTYGFGQNFNQFWEGSSGANQTWDFSTLTFQTYSNNKFVTPDTVYGYSNFATCTDAEQIDGGSSNIFRKLNGNTYSLLGVSTEINNYGYSRYFDPLDLYHFPLTIGTTYSDTYYKIDTFIQTPTAINTVGICNYLVDSYGTLVTPGGTFTNTLRIKAVQTGTDTIYTNGSATSVHPRSITTYSWISASHPGIQLFITTTEVNSSGTYYSAGYAIVPTTDINNLSAQSSIIYPNPATNGLFIETNVIPVEQINIYNTSGSLVSQTKQPLNNYIDISQLADGVYIAEIKTKETSVLRRWVKM